MTPTRIQSYLLLLLVALIWGAAAPVIKYTLGGIDPLPFLAYRFLLSFVIGLTFISATKYSLPKTKEMWVMVIIYSFFSTTIALGFLFLGLDKTTVLNLSLIALVAPLLTQAAGVLFLKEKITHQEKIGTAIAVTGAALTIIEPVLEAGADMGQLSGNLLLLVYLISEVASIVILKRIVTKGISPVFLSHFSFVVGFLTLAPVTVYLYGLENTVSTVKSLQLPHHLGVWYMALFSGTIAYAIRARAQKNIEIGEAALFSYLTSVFSVPIAVIWLKETLTLPFVFGAVIIAVGVFIAETGTNKR